MQTGLARAPDPLDDQFSVIVLILCSSFNVLGTWITELAASS
jgi:hypothetical protein